MEILDISKIEISNIKNEMIKYKKLKLIGQISSLNIDEYYTMLDLSELDCKTLRYKNQNGKSINKHKLPNNLIELLCYKNDLLTLPKLPDSLKLLHCQNNKLKKLPKLPNSLEILECFNNDLSTLPKLPVSLLELYADNNPLTKLPILPKNLKIVKIDRS